MDPDSCGDGLHLRHCEHPLRSTDDSCDVHVSGVVKNSLTGQPIPRALVNAQTDAVLTDSEGRFELRLQEGGAWLQVRRPGYSNMDRRGGHMVRVGAKMAALTLYLIPSAGITGRLTGTNGGDAANIAFTAYFRRTVNGHDRWLPAGAATTNGDGIFKMYDMAAPATYVLCSRATLSTSACRCCTAQSLVIPRCVIPRIRAMAMQTC